MRIEVAVLNAAGAFALSLGAVAYLAARDPGHRRQWLRKLAACVVFALWVAAATWLGPRSHHTPDPIEGWIFWWGAWSVLILWRLHRADGRLTAGSFIDGIVLAAAIVGALYLLTDGQGVDFGRGGCDLTYLSDC